MKYITYSTNIGDTHVLINNNKVILKINFYKYNYWRCDAWLFRKDFIITPTFSIYFYFLY